MKMKKTIQNCFRMFALSSRLFKIKYIVLIFIQILLLAFIIILCFNQMLLFPRVENISFLTEGVKYSQFTNNSANNLQEQYLYMGMPISSGTNNIKQTKEFIFLYNKNFNPEINNGDATEASESSAKSESSKVGSGPKEAMGPVSEQVGTNDLSQLESNKNLFNNKKDARLGVKNWFIKSVGTYFVDPFSTNETLVRTPADMEYLECEQAVALARIRAEEAELAKKAAVEAAETVSMLDVNPSLDQSGRAEAEAIAKKALDIAKERQRAAAFYDKDAKIAQENRALIKEGDAKWVKEQIIRLEVNKQKYVPFSRLIRSDLLPQLPKKDIDFDIRDYDLNESISSHKESDAESSSVISSEIHSDDSLELIQKKMKINALTEQLKQDKLDKNLPKKIRNSLTYHDSDLSSSIHSDDHPDTIIKKLDRLETREIEKMQQDLISETKETKESLTCDNKRSFKQDSDEDKNLSRNKKSKN